LEDEEEEIDIRKIFCDSVEKELKVKIPMEEIGVAHRLGKSLVATFIYRGKDSVFEEALKKGKRESQNKKLCAIMQKDSFDIKLENMVADLKREEKIAKHETSAMSGKLMLFFKSRKESHKCGR